mgnify:CR=1 FL=1
MAGELKVTTTLNKPNLPVTSTQQLAYVLIEILPTETVAQVRMPLNFGFVLDHSGSMSGAKIEQLRDAVRLAIDRMADQDLVSLVVFNDHSDVIVESEPAADRGKLRRQVDRIHAGGGTAISKGMKKGLKEIEKGLAADRVNRMLLLTDGQTFGDEKECVELATDAGKKGIPVFALGLGEDWNEELLDEIAAASGGTSDFVAQPDEIVPLFTQTVQRTQQTVVQNAQLMVRMVAGVVPRQVWQVVPTIANLGYQPISDRDVQVALGEIEAKVGKALLVELLIPPRQPGKYRVAQTEVEYDVPATGVVDEKIRHDILINFTQDANEAKQYDANVMNIVEKVTAFKLQTRALEEAKAGNVAGATQKLRAAATRLLDLGEEELANAALQEADNLEKKGQMSAAGTKKLRYETRKLTQKLVEEEAEK